MLMLVIEFDSTTFEHEHDYEHEHECNYFALEATIASGRYMSRLLPWNSAFNLTVNRERSTRSQRVNCQIVFAASALLRRARGEADPPSFGEPDAVSRGALAEPERYGGWCSNPTTKCTASSRTLFVDFLGSK